MEGRKRRKEGRERAKEREGRRGRENETEI
jgi:hypothetical protein